MLKKIIIISLILAATIGGALNYKKTEKKIVKEQNQIQAQAENLLEVNFICQAPLQTQENWELHEESCEEAALLQAYLYEKNKSMTKSEANTEVLKMINWQIENKGKHEDLYSEKMINFAREYYQLEKDEFQTIKNATIDDIKKIIDQGHPVIVPVLAKELKNPYYPYPGYHMLVAIGYTKDHIITNDNGTRHGEKFSYKNEIFQKAMDASTKEIYYLKFK
ncbi:hypothetical protein COU74_03420 [Candidatus Peregrinibacteria bacterium CG10_big_fil_rev_8_21_14_0_10_36_19]|nr:MAG: hypothetical protein COU74_03420 [Candidatus Peregrinibacteria bacterium CG10_big_fil_rev_8_21_14_0_10_36_19]